ncbi:hypothetical protein HYV44_03480 [Candidatus Microgenomates bacterium]|nr:hypothetical protein [Candidatus Microgenomates bacterium]
MSKIVSFFKKNRKAVNLKGLVSSLLVASIALMPLAGVRAVAGVTITASGGATNLVEGGSTALAYGYTFQLGGASSDVLQTTATDADGAIYTAGGYVGTADLDPTKAIGNKTSNGGTFFMLSMNESSAVGNENYLSKVNADGTLAYTYSFGNSNSDALVDMKLDSAKNVYLLHYFKGTVDFDPTAGVDNKTSGSAGADWATALVKINADGSYGWAENFPVFIQKMRVSSTGIYLTGYANGTIDFNGTGAGASDIQTTDSFDAFATKLNTDGSYGWTKLITGSGTSYGAAIDADASGNVFVSGYFMNDLDLDPTGTEAIISATGSTDIFLVKINNDGTYGYGKAYGNTGTNTPYDLIVDSTGDVYLAGTFEGTIDFDAVAYGGAGDNHTSNDKTDIFLTKINANESYAWTLTFGGALVSDPASSVGRDRISSLSLDSSDNIYLGGFVSSGSAVDMDPTAGTDSQTPGFLNRTGFATKINADGTYSWSYLFAGGNNEVTSVVTNSLGRVYIGGFFQDTLDTDVVSGVDTQTSAGSFDGFVTMLVPNDLYTIALDDVPTADVTVSLTPGNDLTASASSVIFTQSTWNVDRLIYLTAVDDEWNESAGQTSFIEHTSSSADMAFNGLTIADLTVSLTDGGLTDDDVIRGTTASTPIQVAENNTTSATYTISLNDQPVSDVVITPTPADATQASIAPATLTFTRSNWNTPQTVTVTAIDDAAIETNVHSTSIANGGASIVSADPIFNGIVVGPNITVNIIDNDSPAVNITESASSTDITEGGATDSYDVVLSTLPSANVLVNISTDTAQVTAPASLLFTPADWNVPQTVTVTTTDDNSVEGAHTSTITHTSSSSDIGYNGLTIIPVTANITDNDTAGITATESGTTDVTEGGATDTIDYVLLSQPTADVSIALTVGAQVSLSATTLTFTAANWNTPQTITVTAVDDNVAESATVETISYAVTSSDTNYNGILITTTNINVIDNDIADITVMPTGGTANVTEGGATDTIDYSLNTEPTANVVIALTADAQVTLSVGSLTFTSSNWNVPQTVTVTAVNDTTVEGAHTGNISYGVTSSDISYNGFAVASTSVAITDNDSSGGGGGGGGGGGYIPPTPPVVPPVDSSTVTVTSANGGTATVTNQDGTYATISIPSGAVNSDTIVKITAVDKSDPRVINPSPESGLIIIGNHVYEITATKAGGEALANLDSAVTIKIVYAQTDIPNGINEADTRVYYFDSAKNQWQIIEGIDIDTINNKILFTTKTLNRTYALMAKIEPGQIVTPPVSNNSGYVISLDPAAYQYQYVGQTAFRALKTGEYAIITLALKNTGTANWYKDGPHPVNLGTARSQDRNSTFVDNIWLSNNRASRLDQSLVKPGETGTFTFVIKAPNKAGNYKEYFQPVAEGITWMKDIGIYWNWRVVRGVSKSTRPVYSASYAAQSPYVVVGPNGSATLWVEYKNLGTTVWSNAGDNTIRLGTSNPQDADSSLKDSSWLADNRATNMDQAVVAPGDTARFTFTIKAPSALGDLKAYFRPVVDGIAWLEDVGLYWNVSVK